MKILLLGATGATGKHVLEMALARGHDVTVLVRDPAAVTTKHAKLTVVKGQATDLADLERVMAGHDAVLSTLGPRTKADPISERAAEAVITAMQKHGVKRVFWITAFGVADSAKAAVAASFVYGRIIMPLFLKKPYTHHARAEELLRASGLEWTIVRPVQLTDQSSGRPVAVTPLGDKIPNLKIARADVATFMLDELDRRAYVQQLPTVSA